MERLLTTRNVRSKDFDECKYVVVSRHDLHALTRRLVEAIHYLDDNLTVRAYREVDKVYEMLGTINRMNDRARDTVEEDK